MALAELAFEHCSIDTDTLPASVAQARSITNALQSRQVRIVHGAVTQRAYEQPTRLETECAIAGSSIASSAHARV